MTDRHVDFRPYQVRAALAGRLSQTRRVLKPQPNMLNGGRPLNDGRGSYSVEGGWKRIPYAPGDRLWVREGVCWVSARGWKYRADGEDLSDYEADGERGRWRSPIHMRRSASRLTLIVTEVRVQRLQEISRGDAMEEGCPFANMADGPNPRDWYRDIWNSIHGPDAWDANPWVAAISFTVHRYNIDTMEEGTW